MIDWLLMREIFFDRASCGIFQHKSASLERGQFWQEIATNQITKIFHKQYFSGLSDDNHEEKQWLKKYKEIQRTELASEEKTEYKTICCNTCTFLIQKKLQQCIKRHLKINLHTIF